MKEELVNKIINTVQLLGGLALLIFGCLAGLRIVMKEKSIGATKMLELMEADKKMQKDIDELKEKDEKKDELIERLDRHYNEIITKFMDFLKK
jgi:uncharacterized membrane protein (DUF106 family)